MCGTPQHYDGVKIDIQKYWGNSQFLRDIRGESRNHWTECYCLKPNKPFVKVKTTIISTFPYMEDTERHPVCAEEQPPHETVYHTKDKDNSGNSQDPTGDGPPGDGSKGSGPVGGYGGSSGGDSSGGGSSGGGSSGDGSSGGGSSGGGSSGGGSSGGGSSGGGSSGGSSNSDDSTGDGTNEELPPGPPGDGSKGTGPIGAFGGIG